MIYVQFYILEKIQVKIISVSYKMVVRMKKKGFEKLSLRTKVLQAHAQLAKRRPLFTRIVLQIFFRISQSNGTKKIHEIRIWIS